MRGVRRAIVSTIAVMVALAGCGEVPQASVDEDTKTGQGGDPSAALLENPDGTSFLMAAGLGDDLALVRADLESDRARRPVAAAYRTPTGEWADLPLPEMRGNFDLAAVGDTIMFGGFQCISDDCTRLLPRFLVLADDRSSWREVPASLPEVTVDYDAESEDGLAMAYQRPMDHALFTLGFVNYAVHPDTGPVALNTAGQDPSTEYGFTCLSDDTEIWLPGTSASIDSPILLEGVVKVRQLNDAAGDFTTVATVPQIEVDQLSSICGHRAISVYTGPEEHHFDLDSLQWTTRPSNYMEVNHGTTIAQADRGQIALPDGTVYEDNRTRSPDGVWSLIPSGARLVSTRTGVVYALGSDGVTTFREAQ